MLLACSFVAITEAEADTETSEERHHSKCGGRIFVVVGWPKPNDQDCDRHGDADVGIADKPFHFLRQKLSQGISREQPQGDKSTEITAYEGPLLRSSLRTGRDEAKGTPDEATDNQTEAD